MLTTGGAVIQQHNNGLGIGDSTPSLGNIGPTRQIIVSDSARPINVARWLIMHRLFEDTEQSVDGPPVIR